MQAGAIHIKYLTVLCRIDFQSASRRNKPQRLGQMAAVQQMENQAGGTDGRLRKIVPGQ